MGNCGWAKLVGHDGRDLITTWRICKAAAGLRQSDRVADWVANVPLNHGSTPHGEPRHVDTGRVRPALDSGHSDARAEFPDDHAHVAE